LGFRYLRPPLLSFGSKETTPQYTIIVNQIDELVAELVQKSLLNPRGLEIRLSDDGKTYLKRDNTAAIW
jgi:hypothetical protein